MPEICGSVALVALIAMAVYLVWWNVADARWEQRRWEAYQKLGSRGSEILQQMESAEDRGALWDEYYAEELRAAEASLAYQVIFGERADPANWNQNLDGARRDLRAIIAAEWLREEMGGLLRSARNDSGSKRHGGEG